MTEFLDVAGGRIAYDVTGKGPLVVLSHGIGDRRQAYRFLAPKLAQAGYRVANADLRGHGESSMAWTSVTGKDAITRTDIAGDLLALIRHLGGPAVIVGHSISGGAVEKHVASIFTKLGLPPDESDNRRVLAVLRYLGGKPQLQDG